MPGESPTTVDAGHVQVEVDVVTYGLDRGMVRTSSVDVASTKLKLGLTHATDIQLVIAPFHREQVASGRDSMAATGYGATTVRMTHNLWGNDGGSTAAALLPFVTRAEGAWAAGVALPVGLELPVGIAATVTPQLDIADLGAGSAASGSVTTTLAHDVAGPIGVYVESAVAGSGPSDVSVQANSGLSVAMTDDLQLQLGSRVGVLGDVPDFEVFTSVFARR